MKLLIFAALMFPLLTGAFATSILYASAQEKQKVSNKNAFIGGAIITAILYILYLLFGD